MYDVIIIGAGVIGSATAYYLAQHEMKVAILEASNDVSNGTSKANSAIIHAGYDPKEGTKMAKLNVLGSKLTKEVCQKLSVHYQQCGAFVLAFDQEDMKTVNTLYTRGINNGVEGLEVLTYEQIKEMEPEISDKVVGGLYAKTSAIISPWEFTLALAQTAVRNGVDLKLENTVTAITKENDIFTVTTNKGSYQCKYIINAAGCFADKVHELIGKKEFTIYPAKGEYYLLDKAQGARIKHTLFQCPNKDGKGVLVSPTVHGNLIVGPNSMVTEGYDTTTTYQGLTFVKEQAKKSVETIDYRDNIRNFAGVRARSDSSDFIIEESKSVSNFFNLAGICSPGLSAALAIALSAREWLLSKENFKKKEHYIDTREKICFKELTDQQKDELIKKDPSYGKIVCRCETVTEGEILQALRDPIPPVSIDGVKRRCNTSMGRCQGGFCTEKVSLILMKELGISYDQLLLNDNGTNMLKDKAKGGC